MPRTRSCKDLSVEKVQCTIDFPQKKPLQKRTIRKRSSIPPTNDENANCLASPRKKASPFKSPLCDRSNFEKSISPAKACKRLDLSDCDNNNGQQYMRVRQALHASVPSKLISRETELDKMRDFVRSSLIDGFAGSLYMSGAPGTGKTACLKKVLSEFQCEIKAKYIFINCMSLKHSQSIFHKVLDEINGTTKQYSKDVFSLIEKKLTSNRTKILLVLDEVDQLESKNQEVLYKLFEMPFLPKSRLTLVGIANALDLTDRILPRLQARASCKPVLIQFPPYSKNELSMILHERLKEVNSTCVDSTAVEFCARKVSAMTGDARKALDILRRSIELVESGNRKESSKNSEKFDTGLKKITIGHVSSVCSEVYGSHINSTRSNTTFPLQQKIVACTLLVCLKERKIKELTNAKLYESYCRVCQSRQVNHVSQEEFSGICTLLDSQGVICVKEMKDKRNNKISLRLQEQEVEHALQDKVLLSAILSNGIPPR